MDLHYRAFEFQQCEVMIIRSEIVLWIPNDLCNLVLLRVLVIVIPLQVEISQPNYIWF